MSRYGHSEERPKIEPLFAMTNRKSYQRTMPSIIHLNAIFVNSPPGTRIAKKKRSRPALPVQNSAPDKTRSRRVGFVILQKYPDKKF